MVGGLTHFVLYKLIPTASAELLIWLNEWQALFAGLAILIAGTLWTRAIVRSSQRTAHLVSQSLRLMTEAFAETSRRPAGSLGRGLSADLGPGGDLEQRLDRLRAVIRGALSVIPQTNDRVDSNVAQLLKNISNFSLDDERGKKGRSDPQTRSLAEVARCISDLRGKPVESMKCADAWEILVRLHRASRIARDNLSNDQQNHAA